MSTYNLYFISPKRISNLLSSPASYKNIILTYLGWWAVWVIAQSYVMQQSGLTWPTAIIDAAISNLILAIAGYITANSNRFYQPGSKSRTYRFVWSIVLTSVCMITIKWLLSEIYKKDAGYLQFLNETLLIRGIFAFLTIAFMTIISWLWFYMQEQQANENRKADAEKLMREAELASLRQQLQPHFLFNSLNSISALAGAKPEEARKMIQQLSDFLRGTLKKDDQQLVSLEEELQHLQLYLEIEKVRFGHRLSTEIICEELSKKMQLPSLLLQPIVENAIKFGLYDTMGDIVIKLMAKSENNMLHIEVRNPFDKATSHPRHGTGFGLNSVQRRLYLLFGRNDLLSTSQEENIFITTLKIPQHLL